MPSHNVNVRPSISNVNQPHGPSIVTSFHVRHHNSAVPSPDNSAQRSNNAAAGMPFEATCSNNTTNAPNGAMIPPRLTVGTGQATSSTARVPHSTAAVIARCDNPVNPHQQACHHSQIHPRQLGPPPSNLLREQSRQPHQYSREPPPLHPDQPSVPVTLSRTSRHPPVGDAILTVGTGNAVSSTPLPPVSNIATSTSLSTRELQASASPSSDGIPHGLFPAANQMKPHVPPVRASGARIDANGPAMPGAAAARTEAGVNVGENTPRVDGPAPGVQIEYSQGFLCAQQHPEQNQQSQYPQQQQNQEQSRYDNHRQQQPRRHGEQNQQHQRQPLQHQRGESQQLYQHEFQQPRHHGEEKPIQQLQQHQRQQPQYAEQQTRQLQQQQSQQTWQHQRQEPQRTQQHHQPQPSIKSQTQQHQKLQEVQQNNRQEPQGLQQAQQHQRQQSHQHPELESRKPQHWEQQSEGQAQQHQRQQSTQLPTQGSEQAQQHQRQQAQGHPKQQLHDPRHQQQRAQGLQRQQSTQHPEQRLQHSQQYHQQQPPVSPQHHQHKHLQQAQQHHRQEVQQPLNYQQQPSGQPQQHQQHQSTQHFQRGLQHPQQYQLEQPQGLPQDHQQRAQGQPQQLQQQPAHQHYQQESQQQLHQQQLVAEPHQHQRQQLLHAPQLCEQRPQQPLQHLQQQPQGAPQQQQLMQGQPQHHQHQHLQQAQQHNQQEAQQPLNHQQQPSGQPQQHQRHQPTQHPQKGLQDPQQYQHQQLQVPPQHHQQQAQGQPQQHQQVQQAHQHHHQESRQPLCQQQLPREPHQHQRQQQLQVPQLRHQGSQRLLQHQHQPQGVPQQQLMQGQPQYHQHQHLQQAQQHHQQETQQPQHYQQQPLRQPPQHQGQQSRQRPQQGLQQPQQYQQQEPQVLLQQHPQIQEVHQPRQLESKQPLHQQQPQGLPEQNQEQQPAGEPRQHQRQELVQTSQLPQQGSQRPPLHLQQQVKGQPHPHQQQQPQPTQKHYCQESQHHQRPQLQQPLQVPGHSTEDPQLESQEPQQYQRQQPQGQPQHQHQEQLQRQPQQHHWQQTQREQHLPQRHIVEPQPHHSDQQLREVRQTQLPRYETQTRCPIHKPTSIQFQQHPQLHQGQVLQQPWHNQEQTQMRPPHRAQQSQQVRSTQQLEQPLPNHPHQLEQTEKHFPPQRAQQPQQHTQVVPQQAVPAPTSAQQPPSLAANCGNAARHQAFSLQQKERSPSAENNPFTARELSATACTPITDGQPVPTFSAYNPPTTVAEDHARAAALAESQGLTMSAAEVTIAPYHGCAPSTLSAPAPLTLPISTSATGNKRPHHPMDDDIDDNFIDFVQPENCPLPAFPIDDLSPIFGRHRKKARKQRIKPKPELKRRLALWRARIDGGDKTLVYVPLDGVLMEKGGMAFRQHKEDKRVLARYGVTDRPARSSLPERLVRDLFVDREGASDSLRLSHYGIPPVVSHSLAQIGVKRLYEWQAACLSLPGVLSGTSLVYCAPTSGGKSLVAELLMMRRLLFHGLRGLYILPYVSICAEKVTFLRQQWGEPAGVRIEGFFSSQVNTWHKGIDIAVCTIEKASGVLNRLFEENRIRELGTIVMDELHLMQDGHRGYLMELMLLKLKLYAQKRADVNIQVIGLSATLPNVDALASWMGANLYQTTYRPVPLQIFVHCNGRLFDQNLKEIGATSQHFGQKDYDGAASLCWDVVHAEQSVLVFCPTKARCEKAAIQIAELFSSVQPGQASNTLLQVLEDTPAGLCPILAKTLPYKVAYHHAGLTTEERAALEAGFHDGSVRVMCCTSTLAAGVNLPCRRVIIRGLSVGSSTLDQAKFKQMAGRAGRAGLDTFGECFLLVQGKEYDAVTKLLDAELPPLVSAMKGPNLVRAFLETLCLGLISSGDELHAAMLQPSDEVLEVQSYLLERGFATEKVGSTPRVWAWAQSSRPGSELESGRSAGALVSAEKSAAEEEEDSGAEPSTQWTLNVQQVSATQLTLGQENTGINTPSTLYGERSGGRVALTTPRAPLSPVPDRTTNNNEQIGAIQAASGTAKKSPMAAPSPRPLLPAPTPAGQVGETLGTPAGPRATVRTLEPTPLADAATFAAMPPAEGLLLYQELLKVHQEGLLLDSELHLVYLCAPFNEFRTDWQNFNNIMGALGSRERNVAKHVGVNEGFIIQQIQNPTPWPTKGWEHATLKQLQLLKHTRFFVALVVFALLHEQPLGKVAKAFQLNRGDVQSLQSFAGSFCGVVTQFCVRLRWWHFKAIFEALQPRISFGVTDDILPLVQCGLYAPRARLLFEKGYDVEKLARAEPAEVVNILSKHQQFELRPREFICKMAADIIAAAQNRISDDAQQLMDDHSDSLSS